MIIKPFLKKIVKRKTQFNRMNDKKPIQLTDLKKEPPFKVPDGYFNELSTSIKKQIATPQEGKSYSIKLIAGIAASIAIIITSAVFIFINSSTTISIEDRLASVSNQEKQNYIEIYEEYSVVLSEIELKPEHIQKVDIEKLNHIIPKVKKVDIKQQPKKSTKKDSQLKEVLENIELEDIEDIELEILDIDDELEELI